MSAIKLATPSSGSISLSPANTASNLTITVPAVTGTMATSVTPTFTTTIGVGGATPAASGAGITFPATVSASSDANTLDDYEEGTFTPTIASGITGVGYARQAGTYTKIGNLVQIQISIETNTGSVSASALRLGGLPFTTSNFTGGVALSYAYGGSTFVNSTTTNYPTLYIDGNTSTVSFYSTNSSTFAGNQLGSAVFRIDVSGTYQV